MSEPADLGALLRDAAAPLGVEVVTLSDGWVHVLRRAGGAGPASGPAHVVMGHVFPFNTAAAGELCDDKAALADVLALLGVPCVPHHHVSAFVRTAEGRWRPAPPDVGAVAERLCDRGLSAPLVVKPARGTNGRDVRVAGTLDEAAKLVVALLDHDGMAAVAPWVEIRQELRVVLLDGEALCVLDKVRGDDWRHNLSHGATAVPLAHPPAGALAVARAAAEALGLRLATVDCVQDGEGWRVLEVNNGTKLTAWAAQSPADRAAATAVYGRVLAALFPGAARPG